MVLLTWSTLNHVDSVDLPEIDKVPNCEKLNKRFLFISRDQYQVPPMYSGRIVFKYNITNYSFIKIIQKATKEMFCAENELFNKLITRY